MAVDKIRIRDLRVSCFIGVNEKERAQEQEVIVNLVLNVDLRSPCYTDRLTDTLDYHILEKQIIKLAQNSAFFLLERLADQLVQFCLQYPLVEEVFCRIEKPTAPVQAKSICIEITRRREDYE